MAKLLTVKEVEALVPGGKPYHKKAGPIDGFWLRVAVSGRKSWLLSFTAHSGASRTMTLGAYPVLDPAAAFKMARAALVLRDQGVDPQLQKQQRREQARQDQAESVAVVCDHYIEACKRRGERAWNQKESVLRRHVKPRWGSRPIRSITRRDIVQFVDALDAEHGKNVARDAYSKLSGMLRWADGKDMIDQWPCRSVTLPGTVACRDRTLSATELGLVWEACNRLGYPAGTFAKLLLLTCQRRTQISRLTRAEVSISERTISWSADRMKANVPHSIPLCDEAMRVILSLPVHGAHLFSYDGGRGPLCSFGRVKDQIDAEVAAVARERGIEPPSRWTFHDLRRSARSAMADAGVGRDSAELVLAHRLGDAVSQTYNRSTHMPQKLAALMAWEQHLMQIVEKFQRAA